MEEPFAIAEVGVGVVIIVVGMGVFGFVFVLREGWVSDIEGRVSKE